MTDNDVRRIEDKVEEVRLTLAELKGSLAPTLDKITDGQSNIEEIIKDHETRIRAQERFRFAIPSVSVLALVCAFAEAVYYLTHLHH